MSRFGNPIESQAAQLAGTPSGTTFNGYFAAIVAGASADFMLRRVKIGVRGPAGSVTSDQHSVRIYRQTVRVVGTGFSTNVGNNLRQRGTTSVITGIDFTTATTAGTTGPTIGNLLHELTFNTQTSWDIPWDYIEDFTCDQGTANGLAFVNFGNALPASHLFTLDPTWEEGPWWNKGEKPASPPPGWHMEPSSPLLLPPVEPWQAAA